MNLPGETEAGSAGMQPCRGISWWAHRDDDRERGSSPLALFQNCIGSKDPHALKIPARRAERSLTGNVLFPLHAEPRQPVRSRRRGRRMGRRQLGEADAGSRHSNVSPGVGPFEQFTRRVADCIIVPWREINVPTIGNQMNGRLRRRSSHGRDEKAR